MAILVGRRAHIRPIVILALHTGMRRGEILSLRWNQVDFVRGLILVQRTKSGRDRIVPMNSTVSDTLTAIRQGAQGDQVFPINDVKRSFAYACVKAEIATFVSMIFATPPPRGSLITEPTPFRSRLFWVTRRFR
jgi:integrase